MGIRNFIDHVARRKVAIFTDQAAQSLIGVAATFTSLTIADNGGNTQLNSAGVHGLTSAMQTYDLYITWSGGTGVNGFYTLLTVDDVNSLTIDLPYDAGLGTPTVSLLNTSVELGRMTIPAWVMEKPGVIYEFWAYSTASGTANARNIAVDTDNARFITLAVSTAAVVITAIGKGYSTGASGGQNRLNATATTEGGQGITAPTDQLNITLGSDFNLIYSATPLIVNNWIKYERMAFRSTQT